MLSSEDVKREMVLVDQRVTELETEVGKLTQRRAALEILLETMDIVPAAKTVVVPGRSKLNKTEVVQAMQQHRTELFQEYHSQGNGYYWKNGKFNICAATRHVLRTENGKAMTVGTVANKISQLGCKKGKLKHTVGAALCFIAKQGQAVRMTEGVYAWKVEAN